MAYGYLLEAEYEDGYKHREDARDESPYVPGKNIYNDIIEKRPEVDHGPMVRFSMIGPKKRYDVDWTKLPDNARPIYYRDMQMVTHVSTGQKEVTCLQHHFGYQFTDKSGQNIKQIKDV